VQMSRDSVRNHDVTATHDLVTLNRSMWRHNAITNCASGDALTTVW